MIGVRTSQATMNISSGLPPIAFPVKYPVIRVYRISWCVPAKHISQGDESLKRPFIKHWSCPLHLSKYSVSANKNTQTASPNGHFFIRAFIKNCTLCTLSECSVSIFEIHTLQMKLLNQIMLRSRADIWLQMRAWISGKLVFLNLNRSFSNLSITKGCQNIHVIYVQVLTAALYQISVAIVWRINLHICFPKLSHQTSAICDNNVALREKKLAGWVWSSIVQYWHVLQTVNELSHSLLIIRWI